MNITSLSILLMIVAGIGLLMLAAGAFLAAMHDDFHWFDDRRKGDDAVEDEHAHGLPPPWLRKKQVRK